jgi:hypothetical protein
MLENNLFVVGNEFEVFHFIHYSSTELECMNYEDQKKLTNIRRLYCSCAM